MKLTSIVQIFTPFSGGVETASPTAVDGLWSLDATPDWELATTPDWEFASTPNWEVTDDG